MNAYKKMNVMSNEKVLILSDNYPTNDEYQSILYTEIFQYSN